MKQYLKETEMLDYSHPSLIQLVESRKWNQLDEFEKIGAVYNYVQNEILFGYNESDDISASRVLADGYGQCNTKGTLLMALLRAVGIPCRFHGFTIDKALQKGAIAGIWFKLSPQNIIHSWVEVFYNGKWVNLEGFILDNTYLKSVQNKFAGTTGAFSGYGVATLDFKNPSVAWAGQDTYIQKEGINQDFGLFDAPDDFFAQFGVNTTGIKHFIYKYVARQRINAHVSKVRRGQPALDRAINVNFSDADFTPSCER